MYRIGQLEHRITIERAEKEGDGAGGSELISRPVISCWAYMRQLSAKESVQAEKLTASSSCIFAIRNRLDIQESDTIIFKNEKYNIRIIPPRNFRDIFMELIAERGVA